VNGLLKTDPYDLVIIDHVQMSWLADTIAHQGRTVGLAHNIEHQMYRSFGNDQSSGMRSWIFRREGRLLEKLETRFANQVDQMWALTKHDADYFQKIKENGDAKEIPLPASAPPSKPASVLKEFGIGLIGSWTWKANEEGLRWFFDMVYPHCSRDISICIAGNGAGWLDGRYPNVRYMGFVDDARVFLEKARVVAIPTLSGGGIQIKTLDAIASGSPIVATPLALRGIADPPSTVSVAETAEEFADKLLAALNTTNTESSTALAIEWSRQRNTFFSDQVSACLRSLLSSQ
jgi:glycosyltransferase involved in cell wall biosynthesis